MNIIIANIPILTAIVFIGFMLAAAWGDIRTYTITNKLNLIFFLSFFIFAPFLGLGIKGILLNLGVAIIAFLICFALFAIGAFGGGDVKLVGTAAVWLGYPAINNFILYTVIIGGIFALILLFGKFIVSKCGLPKKPRFLRQLLRKKAPIPYGVALCLGGILALKDVIWL